MATRVPAIPQVLKWARERCGLTLEEAAKRLKRTPAQLQKIENGEEQPVAGLFREMARIYALPEADLLADTVPAVRPLPIDCRTHKGLKTILGYETTVAIRKVQERLAALAYLSEINPTITGKALPHIYLRGNPEEYAAEERARIGIPLAQQIASDPQRLFQTWRVIIENQGVSVFNEDFPLEEARGVSLFSEGWPGIILNRNEQIHGARSFTLLHEYAHLLLREGAISDLNPHNKTEAFCNRFAAAFLMPVAALQLVFDLPASGSFEPPVEALGNAARKLGVSISALALRLEQAGYARAGYYDSVSKALAKPAPKPKSEKTSQIPRKYIILSHFGHCFSDAVISSVNSGHISALDGGRLLEVAPTRLREIKATIDQRRATLVHAG